MPAAKKKCKWCGKEITVTGGFHSGFCSMSCKEKSKKK